MRICTRTYMQFYFTYVFTHPFQVKKINTDIAENEASKFKNGVFTNLRNMKEVDVEDDDEEQEEEED